MVQPAGPPRQLLPGLQAGRIGLGARHGEHHFLLVAGVLGQPGHAARALAQQPKQLETAEHAHRLGRGRSG